MWQNLRLVVVACALHASLGSASGPRYAKLDPVSARAIQLAVVGGGTTYCPGRPPQLRVIVTTAEGKQVETWAHGQKRDGRLEFTAFEWQASVGAVGRDGFIEPPADPRDTLDRPLELTVRVAGNPAVQAALALEPTYGCGALVDASGGDGRSGRTGEDAPDGLSGSDSSTESPAGDGGRGSDGQDGEDGEDGGGAAAVEVVLGYVTSAKHGTLVLARVTRADGTGTPSYHLFDPRGEPLTVEARGGDGGRGGAGGEGGDGGTGGKSYGSGTGGRGGAGGTGGAGGRSGDGGDGAAVVVRFDRDYPELPSFVRVDNPGGAGGAGGREGEGGSGGSGGASVSGDSGSGGMSGMPGPQGARAGRDGRPGPAASFRPEAREALFASEIEAGWPIVAPSVPRGG